MSNQFSYPTIGKTVIIVTPSGMWGQKVWQNSQEYVCSGIKRIDGKECTYRFTAVGDASVRLPGEGYNDLEFDESKLNNPISDYLCDEGEIHVSQGWVRIKESL